MSKRLAVTISGAVSLGSYEAGVLYEIIHAIGRHNQDSNTTEEEKIFIDVLTGASAGGMTATIAAQKLLYERGALEDPYANAFYLPWVADVGLDNLLAMHGDDDATKSILSSDTVIDISKRYLTQRYQNHVDPERAKHPASADILHLGLAMANLSGVDYGLPLRPEGQFIYTRHQDKLAVWLDAANPNDDTLDLWDPLRNAAVACGAFPLAFRVIDVIRHAVEYTDPKPLSTILPSQSFAYTDGGTFQNEPLGLAKNLVDRIDNHLDVDSRFYLFVAPASKSSTANSDFNASTANFRSTALRLVSSIFDQARFQDWVAAEQVNTQVAMFNQRAGQLRDLLNTGTPEAGRSAQHFQETSQRLLTPLFASRPPVVPGQPPLETLDQARQRLKAQFRGDYSKLPAGIQDTWIDSILTLETAANLATRDEMTIYAVTAAQDQLASYELFAFAGFFDHRYRDHDYDVGRREARKFMQTATELGPIHYRPEPLRQMDQTLDGLTLDKMDRGVREAVRDRIRSRAHEILEQAGVDPFLVGGAVREAIDLALIKPQLDKLLKL